jgi:hypothetical protein
MGCHGAYLKAMELKHAFCGVFRTAGTLCIRQCVHVMCIIADYLHCFVIGKVLQFVYQFVVKQEAHQPMMCYQTQDLHMVTTHFERAWSHEDLSATTQTFTSCGANVESSHIKRKVSKSSEISTK